MPLSPEHLKLLRIAFRPHAPIEDSTAFIGRQAEKTRVHEALSEPGLQVVIYGEPGCGKTSLSNVATEGEPRVKVFCETEADFPRILRDIAMEFQKTDPAKIVYDAVKDTISSAGVTLPLGNLTGNMLLSILPSKDPLCVILDELDRVKDRHAISSLAELAKNAATNRSNITLILVGVAETANNLLAGHGSNFRNLREVPLGRMEEPELLAILNRGERVLGIKFSEDVTHAMIELCDRMPYYLHLLATNAAREALHLRAPIVELDDLARGSRWAAREADQQLRDTYEHATLSQKGSSIYKRITWAIANLPKNYNNVADITRETNKIAIDANDETVTPQAIGAALKRLASAEKREILHRSIPGVYRFANPLMKGFIRLVRYGL